MSAYPITARDRTFNKILCKGSPYVKDGHRWRRMIGKGHRQEYPVTINQYLAHMLRENGRSESQILPASYGE